ncbi:hypothetical protein [Nonomuraea sediminis]|uniref:hypothetical protein n=1 Tax=Nonomuraea sediminis TaxID=2835864 RepID=UPI001BDD8C90|nr:hypothetical protein [Nonomuraea sediminis]
MISRRDQVSHLPEHRQSNSHEATHLRIQDETRPFAESEPFVGGDGAVVVAARTKRQGLDPWVRALSMSARDQRSSD